MTAWRDVPGFEGLYQVSDTGSVKSLRCGRLLKPAITRRGYSAVTLYKGGHGKRSYTHRLVAEIFLAESRFPGAEVCHNDGDPANNAVENLRWGTRADNIRDSIQHGTHANHRKTHCAKGHPFDVLNTNITVTTRSAGPQRNCRTCNREAARRYRNTKAKASA